jgi:hypothetical protein
VTDVVERYLELGLRLGRHDEDLLDSYYGPPELKERVDAEEPRPPAALAEDAAALAEDTADDAWLTAQVQALGANARKLAGERLDYAEEGRLVYGIEPRWHDEEPFRRAAALLDEALPGSGDVRDRYARWFEETAIPSELVEQAVLDTGAELQRLTRESVGLPDGEDFELELVTGEHWLAYARYLGGLRTHIQFNVDLRMPAADLVMLTSHEIYGGHHTHRIWQEAELVRGMGQVERTLDVLWSPEALLSEGIAMTGPDLVAPHAQELTAQVLGRLGFAYDAELGARVHEARRALLPVSANVAMLIHARGGSAEEARDYAATWSLQPDERVDKMVEGQLASPSPVYQHCYWQGRELVERHVAGDPRRLRELLTARVVPADLAASA